MGFRGEGKRPYEPHPDMFKKIHVQSTPTCRMMSLSPDRGQGAHYQKSTVRANPYGPKVLVGVRGALVQRED